MTKAEQEPVELPPAKAFYITIDFGQHQAKLKVSLEDVSKVDDPAAMLGKRIAPHLKEMLAAEERNHG